MNKEKIIPRKLDKEQLLFESYPVAFIGEGNDSVKSHEEAVNVLAEATRLLHKLSYYYMDGEKSKQMDEFYKFVDEDDFFRAKMFITNCFHDLTRKKS